MPVLKNQRHEAFSQELAKGKSGAEAYEAAGYKPSRKNASILKTNQDVIARVMELQGRRADRVILNKMYLTEAAIENIEKALGRKPVKISRRVKVGDGEYEDEVAEVFVYEGAVANAAIKLAGTELGMFVERKDFRISTEYDKLTDKELADRLVAAGQLLLEDQTKTIEHEEGESNDA